MPFRDVIIVGARDMGLEQMLGAAGYKARTMATQDLSGLLSATAMVPSLLVVDLRGASSVPSELVTFKRHHARVPVLVVAPKLDPTTMLDAMRAGVSEWVTEPLVQSEIEAAVKRAVSTQDASRRREVLAFLGAKGGVGTTTLAVNVATALARFAPGNVLLIDLHLAHGDAAVFLGADPRFTVVDALENTARYDEAFFRGLVTKTKGGPDLLASADHIHLGTVTPQRVRTLIEFASDLYEFVVLDVPRSDAATLDCLDVTTSIVIVANQELATARGASRIGTALKQRYGADRVRIVVTRYDPAADIAQADVERVTGVTVVRTIPSDYRSAVQALNRGRPVVVDNHNALSASYVAFAKQIAKLEENVEAAEKPPGVLGRLLGRQHQ
jgi:pilus assembly protein CpaE